MADFEPKKAASKYARNKGRTYVSPHTGEKVTPSIVKYAEVLHKKKAGTRTAYNYKKELADLKKQLVESGLYNNELYQGDLKQIGRAEQDPDPEYNAAQQIKNERRATLELKKQFASRGLDVNNLKSTDQKIYDKMFRERVEELNKLTFRGPYVVKYTRTFEKDITLEMFKETVDVKTEPKFKNMEPEDARKLVIEIIEKLSKKGITYANLEKVLKFGKAPSWVDKNSEEYGLLLDFIELADIATGTPAVDKIETKTISKYKVNVATGIRDRNSGDVLMFRPGIKREVSYVVDRYDPIYEPLTMSQKIKSRTKRAYLEYISQAKFSEMMTTAGLTEKEYKLGGGKDNTSFRWAVLNTYKMILSEAAKVSLGASLKGVKITHYDPEHKFFEIRIGGVDTKTFRPSGLLVHLSDPVTRNLTNKHRGWIDDAISRILSSRFPSTAAKKGNTLKESYSGRVTLVGDKIAYGVRILKFVHEI